MEAHATLRASVGEASALEGNLSLSPPTSSAFNPESAVVRRRIRPFDPSLHAERIVPLIEALRAEPTLNDATLRRLCRRHPRAKGGSYSKSEILRAFRRFADERGWDDGERFIARLRRKPVRTLSGVAPVTVLTKPYPCPGRCIFCPSDVRMPKSYLSLEPGAQRAAQHRFDPFRQTLARLLALHGNGHRVDKVELIVLGGTWSSYPERYQIWFVERCLAAMNAFRRAEADDLDLPERVGPAFESLGAETAESSAPAPAEVDSRYNQTVARFLRRELGGELLDASEGASWQCLEEAQRLNETAEARCVGLVLETRPDHLDRAEALRLRRLGATKVQVGVQSLDDEVLRLNRRGHDVAASRRALRLLRSFGFKLQLHWMANLYGSTPDRDVEDFARLFNDPEFRPDELKIYPCSLIDGTELMDVHRAGRWRPYEHDELLEVLTACLQAVPPYCRVTRVIRDIPGNDIVIGNKTTNFRQLAENALAADGRRMHDIRAREIRHHRVDAKTLRFEQVRYATSIGEERFLQVVDPEDRIAGFCRLALPAADLGDRATPPDELRGAALLREVHVYGGVVAIGAAAGEAGEGRSQHLGLGRRLIAWAADLAAEAGAARLAVISGIGTRVYYRRLGFVDGRLYQHLDLAARPAASPSRSDGLAAARHDIMPHCDAPAARSDEPSERLAAME
ncbi:MAG: tRNA uridine(34) 5-carboxymethylaminomethyl modification radical SAM/GNAT enzyme Elp3 [Acidobacteriota bacterium]